MVETVVLFAHVDLSLFELCEDSASVQVSGLNQNISFYKMVISFFMDRVLV